MRDAPRLSPRIAEEIWDRKYRLKDADGEPIDGGIADTLRRVAVAGASVEKGTRARKQWAARFYDAFADFGFIPAGRILAGAGTKRDVTLFNCFVMGPIGDDLGAIFEGVKQAALTMQQGGGVGMDFSTLRPRGALVKSIGADASGPVSFMDVWDAMCRTIMSAGARRGAMMATLSCDHPDIETFIAAKSEPGRLSNFNLSVLVTDAFLAAVRDRAKWNLVFAGKVYSTVDAADLWDRLMRATYAQAEPGVIFIDRVNAMNNLAYCEEIHATNPCGEQPLPAFGACLLGSINLAPLVENGFKAGAGIDTAALEERVATAVRFLDNVIDVSNYPLRQQRHEAMSKRRIGLGITGLADALILCGVRYGSSEAQALAGQWMRTIQNAAYRTSAALAAEKGAFPLYDKEKMAERPNVRALQAETRAAIARHGLRNGCLTSIAPTGTISLLAGNVSSGAEPVFDYACRRRVLERDGSTREETVEDWAHARHREHWGADAPLPAAFVKSSDLSTHDHLAMLAALQPHVDSAISKTVNVPADLPFEAFKSAYLEAHAFGLKGCTTFRPNAVTGTVLASSTAATIDSEAHLPVLPAQYAGRMPAAIVPDAAASHAVRRLDAAGDVVYMAKPLERDAVLSGNTYKLKWPASDHAIYVTINDIECERHAASGQGPRRRPFEIFINTRNLEHYAWTVALTRMISAVFRRGGDVAFVAEELKAVFDPQGGEWIGGRYVPSLLAAIGEVIETHMRHIGALPPRAVAETGPVGEVAAAGEGGRRGEAPTAASSASAAPPLPNSVGLPLTGSTGAPMSSAQGAGGEQGRLRSRLQACPRCSSTDFTKVEGCWVCRSCGFSRCG